MKLSSCYFLLILSSPYHTIPSNYSNTNQGSSNQQPQHFLFANSFLQGAHSNTAIRKHYYDTNTLNNAQAILSSLRQQHQSNSNTFVRPTGKAAFSSTTELYGFFDRFSRNRNNEDSNEEDENENNNIVNNENASEGIDNNEEENEDDDVDSTADIPSSSSPMSPSELENAKELLENLFSIPNDNQKKSKGKRSSSSSTSSTSPPSITTLSSQMQSPDSKDDEERNSDNGLNQEQQEILLRTRDITLVSSAIPQPPLTAIARERRLKEISLLSSLTQSDEAVNELWALWIAEKGPAAATLLLRAEQLMSVESYEEAETILWSLIRQYGVHWAEPVNRLATLKYMQGRLEESKTLCEVVLQTKPWHFGALSGIVLVCTAMNDATGARMWADRRLPPFLSNDSGRNVWINHALEDATKCLNEASKVGRNLDIGQEEMEFRTFRAQMQHLFHLEDNAHSKAGDDIDLPSSAFDDNSPDAWQ